LRVDVLGGFSAGFVTSLGPSLVAFRGATHGCEDDGVGGRPCEPARVPQPSKYKLPATRPTSSCWRRAVNPSSTVSHAPSRNGAQHMSYTLGQAAKAVGMSKTSILRNIKAGRISAGWDEFGQCSHAPQANKKPRPYNGFTACTQRLFPLGVHLSRQPEFVAHSPHSSGITPTG
jgi:hypothetical protein